jgi:hypothetical protein
MNPNLESMQQGTTVATDTRHRTTQKIKQGDKNSISQSPQ